MKNKGLKIIFCASAVLVIVVVVLLFSLGYCLSINPEHIKVWNANGGYRSWTISYSDGRTWDKDGNMINLWRMPRFHHCDVRMLMKEQEKEK